MVIGRAFGGAAACRALWEADGQGRAFFVKKKQRRSCVIIGAATTAEIGTKSAHVWQHVSLLRSVVRHMVPCYRKV